MNNTRHMDIFDVSLTTATMIGLGGIGSPTAIALAKMGIGGLTIYDGDIVSEENVATQFYKLSDIGNFKCSALASALAEYSDVPVRGSGIMVTGDTGIADQIVISGVDSITSRKAIWETVKQSQTKWYLDARMAAEEFQLYSVNMKDPDWYDRLIGASTEEGIPDVPCTAKATIFCAFIAAGHLGAAVRRIATGIPQPRVLTHDIIKNKIITLE